MDNRIHGGCSPPRLALRVASVLLFLCVAVTPAASHGPHGNDTGLHKNFLVIVRSPYEYDTKLYKNTSSWHASLLAEVCDMAKEAMENDPSSVTRLLYSYRNVVNGFSARLTVEELEEMKKKDWFYKAYPEKTYHLMTTHTPKMLGLMGEDRAGEGVWNTSNMGEGIIIGVLDDGIYAGHPSFDGEGMKPPPKKWTGRCDFNNTVCNNKLIGARSFFESAKWKWKGIDDPVLPINEGQHGTHTSSTAAGAFVPDANISGLAVGTAVGMAPRAHIAFYQVCFETKGCDRDDILAAVDDAIEDGVDVLSMSLGGNPDADFSEDPVSSARGPNLQSRGILKPDIIGPGVNILAGVPGIADLVLPPKAEMPKFDVKSGTSMSCPHLAGVAALMKNAHPTWSPAAIKSALMTTTETTDNEKKPFLDVDGTQATYFATGAGHVNPKKAMDPGLVYNLSASDYVPYLCGLNYTDQQVNSIIHPEPAVDCTKITKIAEKDLNYPSITIIVDKADTVVNATRAVTNVGVASSTYKMEVEAPKSVTVEVTPTKLEFKELDEVLNYTVSVKAKAVPEGAIEGQLKWVSSKHIVRSPILILPGDGEEEATSGAEGPSAHVSSLLE
ncbi:subtilisin-like protease 4 [Triticum aestivum]|uniref:subtilisin-like protease 4 n=1 Tax=Triticum aestivum TaxID=4565 RepID=UPI001D00BFE8|nr:subtilisin-like protease 4 [Triticum aestivum]